MKGFRKGKVPMALLKKQFGQRVLGDAMQEAINTALRNHLEKSGDRPAVSPSKWSMAGKAKDDDAVVTVAYEALHMQNWNCQVCRLERLVVRGQRRAGNKGVENLPKTPEL